MNKPIFDAADLARRYREGASVDDLVALYAAKGIMLSSTRCRQLIIAEGVTIRKPGGGAGNSHKYRVSSPVAPPTGPLARPHVRGLNLPTSQRRMAE